MKIALIGADGQLGSDLTRLIPPQDLIPLTHKDIEIADFDSVLRAIKQASPQVVINTAAFHRTDECEEKDTVAFQVNALGAKNLALACRETGATLVHLSTDYVFDGEKGLPYEERDVPCPGTAYGVSKLAGEHYIRYILERHFIIRTSALFGIAGCKAKGRVNFIEERLKAKEGQEVYMVKDQTVSPTYTLDLARKILQLLPTQEYGIYHIVNKGYCTWFDFAQKIFELAGIKAKLVPITTQQSGARARRPRFSVLCNRRLEQQGRDDLRTWEEALVAYLQERGRLRSGEAKG